MTGAQAIHDWLALCDAKARYCRTLDTKDWAAFAELLTEDFVLDVSQGTNLPILRGRDAALKMIRGSIETAKTSHQVHVPEIELHGDEARVIWAMQDRVVWGADRASMTGYGHYHQRWVRRSGEWKLAESKLTRLHLDWEAPTASAAR